MPSRENPTLGTNNAKDFRTSSGTGALTNHGSLNSLEARWADKWRELEEIQTSQQRALEKEMAEARARLEKEMNQSIREHEIMLKKQEIQRQQDELRYLEEQSKGTEQGASALEEEFRSLLDMHGEEIVARRNVVRPQASSRSDDLQQLLEKQQQTMDEVVRGFTYAAKRVHDILWGATCLSIVHEEFRSKCGS